MVCEVRVIVPYYYDKIYAHFGTYMVLEGHYTAFHTPYRHESLPRTTIRSTFLGKAHDSVYAI